MDNGELQEENQQMVILIQGLFPAYKKRWCFVSFIVFLSYFISRLMILPVTEVVTYMGLWSEVSEDFWRKMKPDVGMPHRWV